MAESDWMIVPGSAAPDGPSLRAGASAGAGAAEGLVSFVRRSASTTPIVHAHRIEHSDFAPIAAGKGGAISAVLRRGRAGAEPLVFVALQADDVTASAYLLGLDDEGRVTLRKGRLDEGLPTSPVGEDGVLARGSVAHLLGAWVHLRLEVVANSNNDVVLNCRQSLASPSTPVWTAVPGVAAQVIDDVTGIRSGSRPLAGGYLGHATVLRASGAWSQHDLFAATRQP